MSYEAVQAFSREGAWFSNWQIYYIGAINNLKEIAVLNKLVQQQSDEAAKALSACEDARDMVTSYVLYKTSESRVERYLKGMWVEILCCMAVEAFLNYYGVKCIGEAFYKRNYERLGITEKLMIVLATSKGILLPLDSDLTKLVQTMFDRRNALVHHKAKEINEDTEIPSWIPIHEATDRVEQMKAFFSHIVQIDPDTKNEIDMATALVKDDKLVEFDA